ncbi:MAG: nuclear transport factor 2 family protein [Alphaproteobacteria bacterium]|nr:nuclear transport factor 2 family protein [Alphaproteobacteria bacterium]
MNEDRAYARLAAKAKAAAIGLVVLAATLGAAVVILEPKPAHATADDITIVADLDTRYQLAVKQNDAATMDRILHDDFILVLGNGTAHTKGDLLKSARAKKYTYELQDEEAGTQTVRLYGDTAVVTAKLVLKATAKGKSLQMKLWFSDTYLRTPLGWRYAFGQASLPLPEG